MSMKGPEIFSSLSVTPSAIQINKKKLLGKIYQGVPKEWSQNWVKIFYLYNVKIEGGEGLRIFARTDSNS